jgi:hypothetical protein
MVINQRLLNENNAIISRGNGEAMNNILKKRLKATESFYFRLDSKA